MNNDPNKTPVPDKAPDTTYSPAPPKDPVTPPSTAAKGNDDVMSTPAKKS